MKKKKILQRGLKIATAALLCFTMLCPVNTPAQAASSTSSTAQLVDLLSVEDKNTLVSPLSLNMALAMAGNGASGTTKKELEAFLGTSISSYNQFARTYYAKEVKELSVANSLWVTTKKGYPLNSRFTARLKKNYLAQSTRVDFTDEATIKKINRWVSNKTGGMIPKILSKTNTKTRLMLVNALYFDSEWKKSFSAYDTQEDLFTNSTGNTVTTDFMNGSADAYFSNSKATGFAKAYQNTRFEFIAILPKKTGRFTFSELKLDSLLKTRNTSVDVTVKMPKFSFDDSAEGELKTALTQLGVQQAFTNSAQFPSLLSSNKKLKIDRVIQKTKIVVDEAGTKAAAATVVDMVNVTSAGPRDMVKVTLDRPFAFFIYDKEADTILFAGKVNVL